MISLFDLVPATVVALAGMLSWLVFLRHRLTFSTLAWGFLLSLIWVGLDRWLLPFDAWPPPTGYLGAPFGQFDLPFGAQTSGLLLLAIGILLLSFRMYQGRKGFDRIFTLAFSITILTTALLFHFVMFEQIGRQWLHDALEVSEAPLAATDDQLTDRCRAVLLQCRRKPLESFEHYTDTGTLFMFRSRDRVILQGAQGLYPLTHTFHEGQSDYIAAYHIKDGQLIELKDTLHPPVISRVMYTGLNLLSFSVAFVWIFGAVYLISFHRKKLNGRRRLPNL